MRCSSPPHIDSHDVANLADELERMASHPRFVSEGRCRSIRFLIGDLQASFIAGALRAIALRIEDAPRDNGISQRVTTIVVSEAERRAVVAALRATLERRWPETEGMLPIHGVAASYLGLEPEDCGLSRPLTLNNDEKRN